MHASAYINLKFTAIWCYTIGQLAKGKADFGVLIVNGLIRVPYPPTKMSAFINCVQIIKICSKKSQNIYTYKNIQLCPYPLEKLKNIAITLFLYWVFCIPHFQLNSILICNLHILRVQDR